jgi:hypothetical protein
MQPLMEVPTWNPLSLEVAVHAPYIVDLTTVMPLSVNHQFPLDLTIRREQTAVC